MEEKPQTQSKNNQKLIIILLLLLIVLLGVVLAVFLLRDNTQTIPDGDTPKARVMLDENTLQMAMDEAMEKAEDGNVALRYKNNAYSKDGTNFDCFIVNSEANIYDMFLTIYADDQLTDQIFLSGLVPPGSGFESIALEHPLPAGDHMVYVAVTQVADDEETGEQVIRHQVMHTMDFHVEE